MHVCTNTPIEQCKFMKENIYETGAVVFSYYMLEIRKTGHYNVKNLVTFSCIVPICAESKLLHDYL